MYFIMEVLVFNATFNNSSGYIVALSFIGGENGAPEEIQKSAVSHWQTLSHNVVSCTPHHERGSNSQHKYNYHTMTTMTVPLCYGIWLTSWRTWIDLVLQYTLEFYLTCFIVFACGWYRSRPVCHSTFVFFYKKLVSNIFLLFSLPTAVSYTVKPV